MSSADEGPAKALKEEGVSPWCLIVSYEEVVERATPLRISSDCLKP